MKGIGWKTRVSAATVFAVSIFFFSLLLIFMSFFSRFNISPDTEEQKIVIVNPPASFLEMAREIDGLSYVAVESPAIYDFIFIEREISEHNAIAAIAFPTEFEDQLTEKETTLLPDVLTYINPDQPDGANKDLITTAVLENYSDYLISKKGLLLQGEPYQFSVDEKLLESKDVEFRSARSVSARMIMPLLLIIALTYTSMTSGVNSIAGEKEKGTFYGLMLAPITHRDLILGHLLGVFGRTMIPALLLIPLVSIVHYNAGAQGILIVIYICMLFSLMMAAITLLFSIAGRNILAAQTAFLPVFLMILVVCVMSTQQAGSDNSVYKLMPFFGHFLAITDSLMGKVQFGNLFILTVTSIFIAVIFTIITIRLLRHEAFTVVYDSESKSSEAAARQATKEKELANRIPEKNIVYGYRPKRLRRIGRTLSYHFWIPLSILSFFQTLSLIAPGLHFLGQENSYQVIMDQVRILRSIPPEQAFISMSSLMSIFMSKPQFLLSMAAGYYLMIGAYLLIVRKLEKNDLSTLGIPTPKSKPAFSAGKALTSYGRGFLLGLTMIVSVYLLLIVTGQIRPAGLRLQIGDLGVFLAYMMMWVPQGAAEEVMMRGYMLPRIAARFGVPAGVFLSSLLFSVMHASNAGFSAVALVNLFLIASFFALLSLMTQEIFTVCAAHTAWNFAQGNLLGMSVSGGTGAVSLLNTQYAEAATDLWTGGTFGPEGGLSVTVISVLSIMILCFYWRFVRNRKTAGSK
jgi:ABC-type Na+ efflux pump permease subunit/membrane protease YdiL (CAAX protease family)